MARLFDGPLSLNIQHAGGYKRGNEGVQSQTEVSGKVDNPTEAESTAVSDSPTRKICFVTVITQNLLYSLSIVKIGWVSSRP